MRLLLLSVVVVVSFPVLLPLPAAAQKAPPPAAEPAKSEAVTPKKQASILYKAANKEAREGMLKVSEGRRLLDESLAKYKKARDLFASFKIDLNIGGVLSAMGRRTESAKYHEIFLVKMPKTVPPAIVEQAKKKLWDLRKELSSVRLETTLEGIQIQINGEDVDKTPQKWPHYMEPGKHVMILSRDGHVSKTELLVLKKGEHRTIKVQLTSLAEVKRLQLERDELMGARSRKRVIGFTTLAAGAALAVGAAVLYGVGASKGSEAFDGYSSTSSTMEQDRYKEQVESAKGMITGGHVLIGLAAATLGVSMWQLISASRMKEAPTKEKDTTTSVKPVVAPTAGGAALSITGRF